MGERSAQPALVVERLCKDFPSVRALDDVSLAFAAGEVHGIVGENGAGKSTLVKIIAGLQRPTRGRVVLAGEPIGEYDPALAMRRGIAMVHQELNLVDELSVADNIFLGRERAFLGFVNRRRTEREAGELLRRVGMDIAPGAKVKTLAIAQRQMVEIAKALSYDASVLIMDEPTAVLTRREVARLFDLIEALRADGVTVLFISHILPEVLRICDRITVMRDGRVVTTLARDEAGQGPAAEARLGSLMVGRPMADHFPPRARPGDEVVLSVRDLAVGGLAARASFDVRAGEVLGFAGLVGAGRTELAEAVAGLRLRGGGTVRIGDAPVPAGRAESAIAAGIAYLSEDRAGRGLVLGMGVVENITLVSLRRYCRGLLRRSAEVDAAMSHVRRLRIKVGDLRETIDTLSGGNQQKVALAKWLEMRPRVLFLDEPTRGVDIGAKEEIYRLIRELAAEGMACVLISSELNELLGMCHRIAVMRAGRIVRVVEGEAMTEENVMHLSAGVKGAVA